MSLDTARKKAANLNYTSSEEKTYGRGARTRKKNAKYSSDESQDYDPAKESFEDSAEDSNDENYKGIVSFFNSDNTYESFTLTFYL